MGGVPCPSLLELHSSRAQIATMFHDVMHTNRSVAEACARDLADPEGCTFEQATLRLVYCTTLRTPPEKPGAV